MKTIEPCDLAGVLGGAGEFWTKASTWDPKQGRYVGTDDFKRDYGIDSVCQRASCYDSHSGHFIDGDEWNRRESERNRDNR